MHGKKTLSIILVISMFVTALIIPSSVSATETSSITIHYFNGNNFKEPYVYYYSNNNQPVTWPGSAMKAEGNNWYSYMPYWIVFYKKIKGEQEMNGKL